MQSNYSMSVTQGLTQVVALEVASNVIVSSLGWKGESMEEKINCWEYMKCGREPNGNKSKELGVCPASTNETHQGVNKGKNAGRFCWKIAGTMCFESVMGISAKEIVSCFFCPFFKKVKQEEGDFFS